MDDGTVRWLMGDVFGLEDTSPDLPGWYREAACRDVATSVFFPEGQGASTSAAIAVCQDCPVLDQCAAHADAEGVRAGVWGGVNRARRPKAA